MIFLFTGLPGSGKSFDAARNVNSSKYLYTISNSHINGSFFVANEELDPSKLISTGQIYNKGESTLLLVIDECQLLFNSRMWRKTGMDWITFFSQHRKLGYDIILITQDELMVDAQIRDVVDTKIAHVRIRRSPLIVRKEVSPGLLRDRLSLMILRSSIFNLYDTTSTFLPFGKNLNGSDFYELDF